jgi:hypothetical protein
MGEMVDGETPFPIRHPADKRLAQANHLADLAEIPTLLSKVRNQRGAELRGG